MKAKNIIFLILAAGFLFYLNEAMITSLEKTWDSLVYRNLNRVEPVTKGSWQFWKEYLTTKITHPFLFSMIILIDILVLLYGIKKIKKRTTTTPKANAATTSSAET